MKRPILGAAHRGVAVISASTGAGQIVTLIAAPVLSRIYSPEAYGAFAALLSLVAIASTLGSLRLDSAVPIATPPDARNLVKTSAVSAFVAGLVCAGFVVLWSSAGLGEHRNLGIVVVVYLVWVSVMYTVLTSYSLRSRSYSAVAKRNLLQQLGTAGGQLLVSRWMKSALGLTVGQAIGRSLGVASLARESGLLSRYDGEMPSQVASLRRHWRFPLVFMPSAVLNVLGTQLPILFVTAKYGTESAGNLAQAVRFGAVPAALIGGAVASVVLAEMAVQVRAGQRNQRARYLRVSRALLPLGVGWLLLLVLAGPTLLPVLLGPAWPSSGAYVAALAIASASGLIASPLSVVLVLYERAAMNLGLDLFRVVIVLVSGTVAWWWGYGPVAAVFAMSLALGLVYAAIWFLGLWTVSPHSAKEPSSVRSADDA